MVNKNHAGLDYLTSLVTRSLPSTMSSDDLKDAVYWIHRDLKDGFTVSEALESVNLSVYVTGEDNEDMTEEKCLRMLKELRTRVSHRVGVARRIHLSIDDFFGFPR
jgi:hypothetical protein